MSHAAGVSYPHPHGYFSMTTIKEIPMPTSRAYRSPKPECEFRRNKAKIKIAPSSRPTRTGGFAPRWTAFDHACSSMYDETPPVRCVAPGHPLPLAGPEVVADTIATPRPPTGANTHEICRSNPIEKPDPFEAPPRRGDFQYVSAHQQYAVVRRITRCRSTRPIARLRQDRQNRHHCVKTSKCQREVSAQHAPTCPL